MSENYGRACYLAGKKMNNSRREDGSVKKHSDTYRVVGAECKREKDGVLCEVSEKATRVRAVA